MICVVQVLLTLGSHMLVVILSLTSAHLLGYASPMQSCAVGISALLFAFKPILNANAPAYSQIAGFSVPTKYAAWLELGLIQLMVPNASFLGHLSGILAGFLFLALTDPRYSPRGLGIGGSRGYVPGLGSLTRVLAQGYDWVGRLLGIQSASGRPRVPTPTPFARAVNSNAHVNSSSSRSSAMRPGSSLSYEGYEYQAEMRRLQEMGFRDIRENLRVLKACNGNVSLAALRLS